MKTTGKISPPLTPTEKTKPADYPFEWALHPGEFLELALDDHKMSVATLAVLLETTAQEITEVIAGRAFLPPAWFSKLAKAFDTSESYWQKVQETYLQKNK